MLRLRQYVLDGQWRHWTSRALAAGHERMPPHYTVPPEEVDITAIRAQGAGGQNVNKVANAVHLRFDIAASSLPDDVRARLVQLADQRISKDGVVIIKAQQFRSLDKNRAEALRRRPGELRRHHLAGAAPRRPEIDDHRQVRAGDELRQRGAPHGHRLRRQQRLVALAALRRIVETIVGNAVARAAVGTDEIHVND